MRCERSDSYRGDVQRVEKLKASKDANIVKERIVFDKHVEVLKGTTRHKCGTKNVVVLLQ
ncbi:hypothetical protein Scep_005464 [Stephania cephalantha]|uniref:Uncharacterized protein n=1 Tax=Stephania cephalantha TaxID=152367 RepID=A0AAP0PXI3_9MAGN